MKLLASIKSKLKSSLFGKVEHEFYHENKALLAETNYKLLITVCFFSLLMCAFLFVLTFLNKLLKDLTLFYLSYTLFFLIETLIVYFYVSKHKNLSNIFYYIFAIAILYLSADLDTFKSVDAYAVIFYIFLIVIPMLHVCKPIYAVILSVSACIAFCFLTFFVKKDAIPIVANDMLNAICCCIVSIAINTIFINLQLEHLQTKVRLEKLSLIDELTALPNRRSFNSYIKNIFEEDSKNINIIMMDIDNFKSYNDMYGHLSGDECLRKIGKSLQDIAKKYSFFVSRFGGEEFVAIITSCNDAALEEIFKEIMNKVKELNIPHALLPNGKVTISIGYSNSNLLDVKSDIELINFADKALYFSKTNGKNRVTNYKDIL